MSNQVAAGRFKISGANLTALGGSKEIKALIGEITVSESIYQYFPVFNITVVDGINMFEDLQLSGNEKLDLSIDILDENNQTKATLTKSLRIVGYDGYYRHTRAQGYVMVCMEHAAWFAMTKRVSRSMTDTLSNMLQTLVGEVGYTVSVNGQKSVGNHCVVFPNITYNEAFEMLLRKAKIPDYSTLHLFGTVWGSSYISTYKYMVSQSFVMEYVMKYQMEGEVSTGEDYKSEEKSIKNMSTALNLSNPDVSATGGNSLKFHEFDMSKKFYEITKFNIINDGGSLPKILNTHYLDQGLYNLGGLEAYSLVRTTNEMAYKDKGDVFDASEFTPEFMMHKSAVLQNQFGMKHTITVSGNNKIEPGKKVKLKLPKATDPDIDSGTDDWMSGEYLVTEIKHRFGDGYKYTMDVTCQRDSRQ